MAHNRSPLVLTAAEEDAVIRDRLITRTGMTAPITWQKKVMQRFAALSASLVSDASLEESDKLFDGLLDALKVMLLPVQKSFQGVEASRRDERLARELHEKTLQEIANTSAEIERLKTELDTAKIERKNLEECETIRETVAAQPSRAQSTRSIEETQREIAEMEREIAAAALAFFHRKKQFALLMHVIDSIQTEIQEEKFLAIVRNQQDQEQGREAAVLTEPGTDPMLVDEG
ncbi:THO complex subunit 7 [Klebsormidium nitens]|uniref:THO complex subunit 7 n=1 Tax=Klebsormidium nitens TaxID=105231 RepID=A0A1Y1IIW1_KLENI|nr:THO complex subunit 7 [Klebsormidium nitens]|eukprot:GAQ90734.1 THO complex subunit 7 [Klebsormidium nitens]